MINVQGDSKKEIVLDYKISKKRQQLASKIVAEHFEMTLHIDRSINYLWYMYNKGIKKDIVRPFIFAFELNLLVALGTVTPEEKSNIHTMLNSEDGDNIFIAILAIDNFRKQRIKIHGEWKSIDNVSEEFREVVSKYSEVIVNSYSLNKI
jgi:hypothetical protein